MHSKTFNAIKKCHVSELQAVSDTLPAVNGTSVSNSPSHTPTINGHSTCSSLSPSPIHTVNSVNCNNVNNDSNHQRSGSCISDNSTTSPTETTTAASPAYITAIHRKMVSTCNILFLLKQFAFVENSLTRNYFCPSIDHVQGHSGLPHFIELLHTFKSLID